MHQELIKQAVNTIRDVCHKAASDSGWWTGPNGEDLRAIHSREFIPAKLCLIHSEISEAMEGDRKNLMDDKLPHRKMIEVELADALIRILDLAGAMKMDIGGAVAEKMAYNAKREDHKLEVRNLQGGKAY